MRDAPLSGTVVRVRYLDPSGPFAVFDMETEAGERVTVTGPVAELGEGLEVRVTGDWRNHPRFGRRFRGTTVMVLPPRGTAGIAAYLASGRVEGVGPKLADRLVAHFGDTTGAVLDDDPGRLTEVPGIGPARADRIAEAWQRQIAQRRTLVLLCDMGLTAAQAARAVRAYGDEAPARVRTDPFDLARRVSGIGFRTADAIAARLGIAPDSPLRMRAAVRHVLSVAAESGHLYLAKETLRDDVVDVTGQDADGVDAAVTALSDDGQVVVEAAAEGPVVFEAHLHAAERQVAARIDLLSGVPTGPLSTDIQGPIPLAPSQRAALERVASSSVAVLTGGPGTGKTTIVGAILAVADRAGQRILLAAPTGRAAMRMKEATGRDARTLHRLLEFNPRDGRFQRDEFRPLDADWVVVDESSMLDIVMMDRLLRALAPGTRLTLIGDADQLPPVGPGDPFRSLIASGRVPVARLTEVFRQGEGSEIVAAAHRILAGQDPRGAVHDGDALGDFYVVLREDPADLAQVIEHLVAERIPARFGLDPRTDIQVLAPMRRGECGTDALNALLRARLNPGTADRSFPAVGDRVIQIRNNYDRDVYNGDIGIVTAVAQGGGAVVRFEDREIAFDPSDSDDLAPAHAITVHKAQGSEFPAVVVCLHTQHYMMLRRNLLYTAVTRGRRLVVICGNRRALRIALDENRVDPRNTRLPERLQGLA